MNRKLIIKISLMVFALITVCSITLAANSYVPNTDENSSKNDEQTKIVDIEKLKETQIKYDGEDQFKSKLPFKLEKPKHIPSGLREDKSSYEHNSNNFNNRENVFSFYSGENNKSMLILQANDTGRPDGLLQMSEKITIKGIDAWIYDPTNGVENIQILFWNNSKYYNVSGVNLGREELIKVAESMLQ